MQAVDDVGRRVVEGSLLEHQRRAPTLAGRRPLLGGLEEKDHAAGQLFAEAREDLGDTHQDGRVGVVAAGMHHPDVASAKSSSRCFE